MFVYCNNNPVMFSDMYGAYPRKAITATCLDPEGNSPWIAPPYTGHYGTFGSIGREINRIINNSNEQIVLDAEYFAFYKGVIVIRTNGERSGSFGVIFLTRGTNTIDHPEDMLRHEYGHIIQLSELGVVNYALGIFIPSWRKWGSNLYYDKPWEVTADIYGGVESRNPSQEVINAGFEYYEMVKIYGPLAWATID